MARSFLTPIDLNKLELQNAAIQNLATPPGSPTTGQIYYDTNSTPKQLKIWNGSAWVAVGNSQEEIEDFVNGLLVAGTGISKDYNDGANSLTITNTGVISLTGTVNEIDVSASTGAVTLSLPTTITADLNGNASTASTLQTARTISITGDASGSASFNGGSNISIPVVINSSSNVSSITGTPNQVIASASVGAITLSLPQDIHTGANPTFAGLNAGNINVGITGDNEIDTDTGNLTIDSAGGTVTIDDNLTVTGDLTVSGSVTYLNTQTLQVSDNLIVLNYDVAGSPTENAGIEVERGSSANVSLLWNETDDRWTMTNNGTNFYAIAKKYSVDLSSSSTIYVVNHNLNDRDVVVNVYRNSAPYDTVETDIERTDANNVTLRFAVAPSSNEYRVVVLG